MKTTIFYIWQYVNNNESNQISLLLFTRSQGFSYLPNTLIRNSVLKSTDRKILLTVYLPNYKIKLIASKKPVIREYATAEAIAGTTFSILSGSFLNDKMDFIASGTDTKLISE